MTDLTSKEILEAIDRGLAEAARRVAKARRQREWLAEFERRENEAPPAPDRESPRGGRSD